MTKPTVRIHNIETDEIIDREMNDSEYAAYLEAQTKEAEVQAQKAQAEKDKTALLAKLGITADEAKLLLS